MTLYSKQGILRSQVEEQRHKTTCTSSLRNLPILATAPRALGLEKKMKVLVIDDTQVHLDAAIQLLGKEHDLTVCSSHDEAYQLLGTQYAPNRKALEEQYERDGMKAREAYIKARDESELPYWDVVLTDLLMPAGSMSQGGAGRKYVGQEMAVGWSLALHAAKMGAKHVAVVTDMNHHHHPASAMLDAFDGHVFSIDGAQVLMTNSVQKVGIVGTEGPCAECNGAGKRNINGLTANCWPCKGSGTDFRSKGKDWLKILGRLLNPEEEAE